MRSREQPQLDFVSNGIYYYFAKIRLDANANAYEAKQQLEQVMNSEIANKGQNLSLSLSLHLLVFE